ncbi:phage major capsid protein [Fusobacterium mortiferum]|uniref:Phage major capsid protein n=1 Tax=Fusobacterium mortiferum TaxID=850 RepID=A0ABS2G0Z5_FUSMR|nr:phage major capsid protein [Fusobacterium mortiferum]MBM6874283.1 phage major capsid protein [Fusobacterium mortiferum]
MNNNEYLKSFQLKYDKSNENPYYFEGIASTYKNIDKSGDLFLDGALDEEIGKRVPILNNHKGDILEALGYGEISRDGNNIIIKGEFIQGIELAERVVALKKGGVPISLSIGGFAKDYSYVKRSGMTVREIKVGTIKEVSVCLSGVNPKARITKSENIEDEVGEDKNMENFEKLVESQVAIAKSLETVANNLKEFQEKNLQNYEKSNQENKEAYEKAERAFQEQITELNKKNEALIAKIEKAEKDGVILGNGVDKSKLDYKKHVQAISEYIRTGVMNEYLKSEASLTTATDSGEALIPDETANEIIKGITEVSPFFRDAKVYQTTTNSLKIPVRIETENGVGGEKEGGNESGPKQKKLKYTYLTLEAGKIATVVRLTQEIIDDAGFDVLAEVSDVSKQDFSSILGYRIFNGVLGEQDDQEVENQFEGIYTNTDVTGRARLSSLIGGFTGEDVEKLASEMQKTYRIGGKFFASTKAFSHLKAMRNDDGTKRYEARGNTLIIDSYVCEEDPYMDRIEEGKYPVLFCNPKEFYAIIQRKGIGLEKDRNSKSDAWDYYSRARLGGKVRKAYAGQLLKIRSSSDPVPTSTLTSIEFSPKTGSLSSAEETKAFKVLANYSDGSQIEISSGVTFKSSDETKATVDNKGVVTAKASGSSTITASYVGLQATAKVTVSIG